MTTRKFTPPTVFPTEYVTRDGRKAVVVARLDGKGSPLLTVVDEGDKQWYGTCNIDGGFYSHAEHKCDLHDLPKRIVTWHNVDAEYTGGGHTRRDKADHIAGTSRLCVYRIERDEDGGNPTITVEQ